MSISVWTSVWCDTTLVSLHFTPEALAGSFGQAFEMGRDGGRAAELLLQFCTHSFWNDSYYAWNIIVCINSIFTIVNRQFNFAGKRGFCHQLPPPLTAFVTTLIRDILHLNMFICKTARVRGVYRLPSANRRECPKNNISPRAVSPTQKDWRARIND